MVIFHIKQIKVIIDHISSLVFRQSQANDDLCPSPLALLLERSVINTRYVSQFKFLII